VKKLTVWTVFVTLLATLFGVTGLSSIAVANGSPSVVPTNGSSFNGWTGSALSSGPTFSASGFTTTPTFSISPSLPTGMTIDSTTGTVSGTPTSGIDQTTFTVTASNGSETATTTFTMHIVQTITVTASNTSLPASSSLSTPLTLTFGHSSLITSATGEVSVVMSNMTFANTSSCGSVSISPAATSCSISVSGSQYVLLFSGVDFSDPSSTHTITFVNGAFTTPASGSVDFNVNLRNGANMISLNAGNPGVMVASAQNQVTQFTVSNFSFSTANNSPVGALSSGSAVPGFTYVASGFSNNAQVNMINLVLGDPDNNIFYTVPNAVQQSGQNYVSWDPGASTCGITALSRGGVALNASSGVTCNKFTGTFGGVTQYWVSIKFATASSESVGIQVAEGVFVSSGANSAYKFSAILFNTTNNSTTARGLTQQAFSQAGNGEGIGGAPSVLVSMSFPVSPGQRIFGEAVTISATDLAVSTDYSVVLRSTPQILAQGRTVSSSFNTSVTIPDNLEAGWHSITFSATRSNGEAMSEVVYFKITADGTLLETSTTQPAELALTPAPKPEGWYFAFLILLVGIGAFVVAREINPEFMRVMTLARNDQGEWEFTKRRIRSDEY
jgi:hypothetical protein